MMEDRIVKIVAKMTKEYGRLQSALLLLLMASLFSTVIILAFSFLLLQNLTPREILVALFAPLALLIIAGLGLKSFMKMLQQREDKLKQMVPFDSSSGAFNYEAFLAVGRKEWDRAQRHNYDLSSLVVDFSDLSPKDDKTLEGLVVTLTNSIRSSDTIARSGEYEFAILLTDTAGDGPQIVAERMHNNAKRHLSKAQSGLSIGMSSRTEHMASFEAMVDDARKNQVNIQKKQDQAVIN